MFVFVKSNCFLYNVLSICVGDFILHNVIVIMFGSDSMLSSILVIIYDF